MTTPRSLTGRYQLVILGVDENSQVNTHAQKLVTAVRHAFDTLGINSNKFLLSLMPGASEREINRRMPAVAVFFGLVPSPQLSLADTTKLATILNDGGLVIPIVDSLARFSTMVTSELSPMNGLEVTDCGDNFERLAARVLEGFGLLREKRRLFISYRRTESSSVATQLYEALDAAGFDVFLDTQGGIRPGEPFQEVLWHRLADTDVAVLLDTPKFLESRWTEEELARANTSNIQLLQVLWPGTTEGATAAFSTFHPLSNDDFVGDEIVGPTALLKASVLSELVDQVEGLRARAFGARHAFLIREFAIEARTEGIRVLSTLEKNLIVSTSTNSQRVLVMPAIGVPDALEYESLERLNQRDLAGGQIYSQAPVLLYDQTGIRSRWLEHLGWLNRNIACARSVAIIDARQWLQELKLPIDA